MVSSLTKFKKKIKKKKKAALNLIVRGKNKCICALLVNIIRCLNGS